MNRFARRLFVAVLVLAIVDRFVPSLVAKVERERYESDRLFRFENSDLFSLGPLVSYLQEHPRGTRPRVAFFGDSMIWGYFVKASETVAAQFQRLEPSVRVFNFGVNTFETGSALLMAKAVADSVETLYVLDNGANANRRLPDLIHVDEADLERFRLDRPDRVERTLERALGFWNLYADGYRLQSGLFGTSTRLYLYQHKGDFARRLLGRPNEEDFPAAVSGVADAARTVAVDVRRAMWPPSPDRRQALAARYPLLWEFGLLASARQKRVVVISVANHSTVVDDEDRADLNAAFFPSAVFIRLDVPQALKIDTLHLTPLGSAALAEVLARETPPFLSVLEP